MVTRVSYFTWKTSLECPMRIFLVDTATPSAEITTPSLYFYQVRDVASLLEFLQTSFDVALPQECQSSSHVERSKSMPSKFCHQLPLFLWVDVFNLSEQDSFCLQEWFNLDPLTTSHLSDINCWAVEDVTFFERRGYISGSFQCVQLTSQTPARDELPKQALNRSISQKMAFPTTRCIAGVPCNMTFTSTAVEVLLCPGYILTVRHGQRCESLLDGVHRRVTGEFLSNDTLRLQESTEGIPLALNSKVASSGASWVLYCLLDSEVDNLISLTNQVRTESQRLDDLVFTVSQSEREQLLRQLTFTRARALKLRQLIENKKRLLWDLTSTTRHLTTSTTATSPTRMRANSQSEEGFDMLSDSTRPLLYDVYYHVTSCSRRINTAYEVARDASSNFLTRLNADLARRDRDMNVVLKKLCWITVLMYPINHIHSLMGMNIRNPLMYTMSLEGSNISDCVPWILIGSVLTVVTCLCVIPVYWKGSRFHLF